MKVTHPPGAISKLRRSPWRFQQTFSAEGELFDKFFAAIIAALGDSSMATLTIAEVNTGTRCLSELVGLDSARVTLERGTSIVAENGDEIARLLDAAFRDGNNFLFVPVPKPFVMFDDDGYSTFFANSKSNLNLIAERMESLGVSPVRDWHCKF